MQAAAEEDAAKKVELFKRQQRLEIEGLVARIERGRAEHLTLTLTLTLTLNPNPEQVGRSTRGTGRRARRG